MAIVSAELQRFLAAARVARMATVDASGQPYVLPICFWVAGDALYSVVDEKPKRVPGRNLQRLRNLAAHPSMAVVVDVWDEDWSRLAWVMLRGVGSVVHPASRQAQALAGLRAKYPQYRAMRLEEQPLICMDIRAESHWGAIGTG